MTKFKAILEPPSRLLFGLAAGAIVTGILVAAYFVLIEPTLLRESGNQSHRSFTRDRESIDIENETGQNVLLANSALEKLLSDKSPYTRTLFLHRALSNASAEELFELYESSDQVDLETIREEIQNAVIRRLSVKEPKTALLLIDKISFNRHNVLVSIVFEEWSVTNFDQAVEHAVQLAELDRIAALDGLLNARFDLSERDLRAVAVRLGHEQRAIDSFARRQLNEPVENASVLWHRLHSDYGNDPDALSETQIDLLVQTALAWVENEGVEVIETIYKSAGIRTTRTIVVKRLLEQIATDDPQRAFDIANAIPEIDRKILTNLIEQWARVYGIAAFEAAATVSDPFARKPMQRETIRAWGEGDPHSLLATIARLPEEFRALAFSHAMRGLAQVEPNKAVSELNGIDDLSTKAKIAEVVVDSWSERDPLAALQWVQTATPIEELGIKLVLQSKILTKLAQIDPHLALNIALDQPLAETEVGLESAVIIELANQDLDLALSMLDQMRNQATRESTYVSLGYNLFTAGKPKQAIELVQDSSEAFQKGYFQSLTGWWAFNEPLALFNVLELLPTEAVRNEAAVNIVLSSGLHISLNKEQRQSLKKYVHEFYWDKL